MELINFLSLCTISMNVTAIQPQLTLRQLARGELRSNEGKAAILKPAKKFDLNDADIPEDVAAIARIAARNGMPDDIARDVHWGGENSSHLKRNKKEVVGKGDKVSGMSKINYEPLTKLGSRRMMNQVRSRAGGDPNTEGKWRVLKLGDGTLVTINLVCSYCGQDNTTSEHRRLRCDLCDRPFRQRGYTRAVGARLPPGKLHV